MHKIPGNFLTSEQKSVVYLGIFIRCCVISNVGVSSLCRIYGMLCISRTHLDAHF